MKQADLLKKIEQLEERVRQLEARPVYVPYAVPTPYQQPYQVGPWRWWEGPTCTGTWIGSGAAAGTGATTTVAGGPMSISMSGATHSGH